jgi:hypothetical protein
MVPRAQKKVSDLVRQGATQRTSEEEIAIGIRPFRVDTTRQRGRGDEAGDRVPIHDNGRLRRVIEEQNRAERIRCHASVRAIGDHDHELHGTVR